MKPELFSILISKFAWSTVQHHSNPPRKFLVYKIEGDLMFCTSISFKVKNYWVAVMPTNFTCPWNIPWETWNP